MEKNWNFCMKMQDITCSWRNSENEGITYSLMAHIHVQCLPDKKLPSGSFIIYHVVLLWHLWYIFIFLQTFNVMALILFWISYRRELCGLPKEEYCSMPVRPNTDMELWNKAVELMLDEDDPTSKEVISESNSSSKMTQVFWWKKFKQW